MYSHASTGGLTCDQVDQFAAAAQEDPQVRGYRSFMNLSKGKIICVMEAPSHYVTKSLDDGPIIAQSTAAGDHRDTIDDLVRKGRDLERMVLTTAVRQHLEDRILVSRNKTLVFD